MSVPVFEHTLVSIRALIHDENEPLQKISHLIKYDPGLYFSLLKYINSLGKRNDVTSVTQAISLIGAEGGENFILQQDYFLDEDYLLLWCFSVMAGEAAMLINERVDITGEEEAFFAGILPAAGMLLMTGKSGYNKVVELLLKVPLEQRVFIEEGLFKTNNIEQLSSSLQSPETCREIISFMGRVFSKDGQRHNHLEHPARFSMAHKSFQLFRLIETADAAARALLFPQVVEAQEKFRSLSTMYFKISESEIEELLADILEKFESVCREFKVEHLSERFIINAEDYRSTGITFLTKYGPLKKSLEHVSAAIREGRNILIYGEPSAGKRLLAVALHRMPDNPRHTKPFISLHCASLDSDTLEIELFGTKGGFLGHEKHKGTLELANGGTLLLKDVDVMPLTLQDRLAEIFGKDEFYKIGDTHPASFDIQLFITSKKNIMAEEKEGRFSSRLLTVLKPVGICIPPLRERREDIEFIADNIIEKYNLNLTDAALRLGLREYYENQPFPDNLRDLKRLLFFLSAKHSLKS